jgi:hypothetical protein
VPELQLGDARLLQRLVPRFCRVLSTIIRHGKIRARFVRSIPVLSVARSMIMSTQSTERSHAYAEAVAEVVAVLPPARAAQVYDFARFLQAQSTAPLPAPDDDDDWLNDPEEQLLAEDAHWAAFYEQRADQFLQLRDSARREIASGETQPLFDEDGG